MCFEKIFIHLTDNVRLSMIRTIIFAFIAAVSLASCSAKTGDNEFNHNYMWFDCEANYATLSHPDSILFYMKRCQSLGFDNVVVDMKSIMGEVLYDSKIAP